MSLDALFFNSAIVRAGGHHLRKGRGGQDHAVSLASEHGIVLVAADGISTASTGGPSRNEVGAWLVGELAAAGARAALGPEAEPNDVRLAAVSAVVEGLQPVYRSLGRRATDALATTLVLGVVTARWTAIWASGDGCWGLVTVPGGSAMIEHRVATGRGDEGLSVQGALHLDMLRSLLSTSARHGTERAASELRLVGYTRSAVAAYVATDGLRDEPSAAALLAGPLRSAAALEASLSRPPDSDDLGVAWAAVRFPGLAEAIYET